MQRRVLAGASGLGVSPLDWLSLPGGVRIIARKETQMATVLSPIDSHVPPNFIIDVSHVLTGEQFEQLCRDNRDTRMELTSQGELILMPPTGSMTGLRNSEVNRQFANWTKTDGSGLAFDSSTGFTLPNGARRSPDAAWVRRERWEALTEEEQEGFAPLCPDFVIELRSRTDNLPPLEHKMIEYIENGASMAWMLDQLRKRVYIYRPGQPLEVQEDPATVTGDPLLPGFVLNLGEIW
jgi:Uma2 family endonuclease